MSRSRVTSMPWRAALAALVLAAAACTSDRGEDPTASGSNGGGSEETQSEGQGTGTGSTDGFGDLESPCGEAEEGDEGGEPSAGGEQGVTADQVVIGYGDDAGFAQSPGLSHETSDAIEAFIAWCNDEGGINGRDIVGNYYDAAVTEVTNAVTDACGEVFMLVGQAWALDSSQEETRLGCDLPMVPTYTVSAEAANAPLKYQAVPNPIDLSPTGGAALLAEMFPDEVQNATVMYGNVSATIDTSDKFVQTAPEVGWELLDCPQEYNITGEPDWRPFVQQLEDCGAEIVNYVGQAYPHFQNLLDAAAQEGYEPIWLTGSNSYLASFAEWNASGNGDNVYLGTAFTPFEQAGDNPATQQYIDIVESDGGDISQLGQQAASSFLLWATAAEACGADLTRDCVMDELAQVTSWTGGGMHAETNPADNRPPDCVMLLELDGTEWVQAAPEEQGEFACDESSILPVTGRVVEQAELNDDRVSTKYGG
jgi:ABC-type branched-subunit amino acid transport system substrate-binding protein